ncbi:orotidine-5'-phosphate decarboxylase [candidate division LCP-89 bacterium B3_LCP]|uniref:Orotidine-5'-phosphate decarboxylase n=1 Tax=candidate division LCP-89 bacterium B3_LCP TaxID=2012998 RepID=A0A532V5K2_UNCL8|nr:MAG: orotidine-5'-phosphate decarboxylase [candidate division LCP-89 bacterium B3_LCP]
MTFREKLHLVTGSGAVGLCIGLDPDPARLPEGYSPDLQGISSFLTEVISISTPHAAAYKVNTAFYEAWGAEGWALLEKIAHDLPESSLRIADAKRGDIGNTAKRYAHAFLERIPFDAITLNPYMGGDTLQPFLRNPHKGAFVLALTTNPGSKDLQRFSDGKFNLYERVLDMISHWAPQGNLGAVVGATHPDELVKIRRAYPSVPLLIPGIGAQGGDAETVAQIAEDVQGEPLLVNVSRGILYPDNDLDFQESIESACLDYKKQLKING